MRFILFNNRVDRMHIHKHLQNNDTNIDNPSWRHSLCSLCLALDDSNNRIYLDTPHLSVINRLKNTNKIDRHMDEEHIIRISFVIHIKQKPDMHKY